MIAYELRIKRGGNGGARKAGQNLQIEVAMRLPTDGTDVGALRIEAGSRGVERRARSGWW
jgi:hypothetical protein